MTLAECLTALERGGTLRGAALVLGVSGERVRQKLARYGLVWRQGNVYRSDEPLPHKRGKAARSEADIAAARQRKAEQDRERRRAKLSQGLCGCGHRVEDAGRRTCHKCRAAVKRFHESRYAEARGSGLCIRCKSPSGGYQLCDSCSAEFTEYQMARRAQRAAIGMCATCGKRKPPAGLKNCDECRERASAYNARHRANRKAVR